MEPQMNTDSYLSVFICTANPKILCWQERIFLREIFALRGFAVNPGLDFHREGAKHAKKTRRILVWLRLCCSVTLCLCGEKGTMKEPVVISWSGGKDSAMALYEVQRSGAYDVLALLTTVTADYDRVSMHGVRRELVQRQAQSLGVSLEPIWISKNASNEEYEWKLLQALRRYQDRGVRRAVFGDLFLEDIRAYRENVLGRIGMSGIYPIWQRDTTQMAQ